ESSEVRAKDAGVEDAPDSAPDAGPSCAPTDAIAFDAQPPGTFGGGSGAQCSRDIDCTHGSFCFVVEEKCSSPKTLDGPGTGGHLADGSACAPAPAFPSSCDSMSLAWSNPSDVSKSDGSLAESDCSIVSDGHGKLLVAWANNRSGSRQQFNGLAISTD